MAHLILQLGAAIVEPMTVPRRLRSNVVNVRGRAMLQTGLSVSAMLASRAAPARRIAFQRRSAARFGGVAW